MAGETLSQAEIDALFAKAFGGDESEEESADSSGESNDSVIEQKPKEEKRLPEKKYVKYDFKNPKIFSKENMRIINLVHENYAKHLSSFLSGILRTECALNVIATEEQRYYEYNNALPESLMLGVVELNPIEETVLIAMKKETCYTVIDRILGGSGDYSIIPDDFTDIELRILRHFCEQIVGFFKSAWSNVMEVNPIFRRIETNARLSQLLPFDEIIIIVAMSIRIMDHESNMSICIPCINLENVLSDTTIYMVNNRKTSVVDYELNKENIFNNLKTSKVDIRGILGNTSFSLKELLQLQVGDVIPLDKPVETPVVLKIGSNEWFNGEIGTKKNKIAVKIKNVLQNTMNEEKSV